MRLTPSDMVTVTQAGSPSGMAQTAMAIAMENEVKTSSFKMILITKMRTATKRTMPVSQRLVDLTLFVRGVSSSLISSKAEAIFPISVFIPTSVTTPRPRPYVTTLPMKAILTLSPIMVSLFKISSENFSTASLSPVKALSSIFKLSLSMMRKSAGTISPASKITISPTTKSSLLILCITPFLKTLQNGLVIFFSACIACSLFLSCQ